MKDLRTLVAEMAGISPDEIGDSFSMETPAFASSLRKAALVAAIRKNLGVDCMKAGLAKTFGELESLVKNGAARPANGAAAAAPAPAAPGKGPRTLSGPDYSLVPFREENVGDRYIGWLNDPEVNRYLEVRFARQTRESALEYVRSYYGGAEKYMWGIVPAGVQEPVGTATLYHIDRNNGAAELGLLVGEKAYWNMETAVAAIRLLAGFAFGPLGLRRLTGGTCAPHEGMNYIYRLLGFRREGVLVKGCQLTPGTFVDFYRWGILAEEWRGHDGR